jgi:hypothetical protein
MTLKIICKAIMKLFSRYVFRFASLIALFILTNIYLNSSSYSVKTQLYQVGTHSKQYKLDTYNYLCSRELIPFDDYVSLSYYNARKSPRYLKCTFARAEQTHRIATNLISIRYIEKESFIIKLNYDFNEHKGKHFCDLHLIDDNQTRNNIGLPFLSGPFFLNDKYELVMNQTGFYLLRCFKVKHDKNQLIFKDLFTIYPKYVTQLVRAPNLNFPPPTSHFSECETTETSNSHETKMNLLLLGFNSLSLNNIKRAFPLTYKYLSKELERNVVYDYFNSATRHQHSPDVFSILTGKDSLRDPSDFESNFILRKFYELGYLTSYNVDKNAESSRGHLFDKNGPISVDFTNFWLLYDKIVGSKLCLNGKHTFETQQQLILSFMDKMNDPVNTNTSYFSLNYFNYYFGGETLSYPDQMDREFKDMLEIFEKSGYLDNTLLVVFSDRGSMTSRYSMQSSNGRYESFSPFLSLRLPKSFLGSEYYKNAAQNKNKLISHFDLHKTLQHFYYMNKNSKLSSRADLNEQSVRKCRNKFKRGHGISLFEIIPVNRSCADALIPENVCACNKKFEKIRNELEFYLEARLSYIEVAKYVTELLNYKISSLGNTCRAFKLQSIVSVQKVTLLENSKIIEIYYSFAVSFQPDNAVFEAEISINKTQENSFKLRGKILRISKYDSNKYSCVSDTNFAGFCLCRFFIKKLD